MKSIDEQIRKAIEEGQFNNLKGKGKPLNLDDNPYADPEWKLAHHVLKNGGFTLPWIETRQEIDNESSALQIALQRAWEWREDAYQQKLSLDLVENEWQRARQVFMEKIEKLNKRIRSYNLEAPADQFQVMPLNAERIIERITGGQ